MKSLLCKYIVLEVLFLSFCSGLALETEVTTGDAFTDGFEAIHNIQRKILEAGLRNVEIWRAIKHHPISPANVQSYSTDAKPKDLQFSRNDTQCEKDILYTFSSPIAPWALQMIDAFGKPHSGLLQGEVTWPGSYDECLQVKTPPSNSSDQPEFHGRFAWLVFKKNSSESSTSISVGSCFPSSCAEGNSILHIYQDFIDLLGESKFLKKLAEHMPLMTVSFTLEDYPLSSASVACITICALFVVLVLLGTLVECLQSLQILGTQNVKYTLPGTSNMESDQDAIIEHVSDSVNSDEVHDLSEQKESIHVPVLGEFLLCFSAIRNTKSIMNTSSLKEQLQCIHGIRFLSMAWVILGHTYYFGFAQFANPLDLVSGIETWPLQVVLEGTYSVDTFFLLSGCLLTYLFLKNADQFTGAKMWITFYVHRYVRLTPVYAMMLFVLATWWNNLSLGPFWNVSNSDVCAKSWWWNFLYINNFSDSTKMCFGWAWYLANDMQFYVISPVFLLAYKRNRLLGLGVVGVLLVASWIATGVISNVYDLGVLFGNTMNSSDPIALQAKQLDIFDKLYDKPYTRIGPYLIGVLLGFALTEVRGKQRFLNKYLVFVGWAGSQTLSLVLIYGLYKTDLGPITSNAHNTLSRSAWGISVAWVIFACLTGHAGPVNTLLSWKMWIPLSRLTYCAYLVHPMVIMWYYTSLRDTIYFSNAQIVMLYLAFVVLSYGVAFIASLLFEAPVMKIEKFIKKL